MSSENQGKGLSGENPHKENAATAAFIDELSEEVCRIGNVKIAEVYRRWKISDDRFYEKIETLKAEVQEWKSFQEPLLAKIEELEAELKKIKPITEHFGLIAARAQGKRLSPAKLKNILSGHTKVADLRTWQMQQACEEVLCYLQLDLMPATMAQQENAYWERLWHLLQSAPVYAAMSQLVVERIDLERGRAWLADLNITDFVGLWYALMDRKRRKLVIKAARKVNSGQK